MPEAIHKTHHVFIPQRFTKKTKRVDEHGNVVQDSSDDFNTVADSGTDTFVGEKNPFYKSQISQGENATTFASGVKYRFDQDDASITGTTTILDSPQPRTNFHSEVGTVIQATFNNAGDPDSSTITRVTNRCITTFLNRCQSIQSSIEAGQDFGEYKETYRGLMKPAGALQDYVFSFFPRLKRNMGKTKNKRSLIKTVADTYLEWNFGWNPLVADLADAYVGLQNAAQHFDTYPVHAKGGADYDGQNTDSDFGAGFIQCRYTTKSHSNYSVKYKGAIRVHVNSEGTVPTSTLLQLTPHNWLPTAWDLLPYSFIADYFLNIGDIIRAFSFPLAGLRWTCGTTHLVHTREIANLRFTNDLNPTPSQSLKIDISGGNSKTTVTRFTRFALDGASLVPQLQFHLPPGPKQWANMGAILISRAVPLVRLLT